MMRIRFWLPFLVVLLASASQAATIDFQVTSLGGTAFRYNYFPSGIAFQANQQLDIRFDPALYGSLSNGIAGSGFSVLLLQPNNPPGTFGDYTALALVNNPSLAGPFSVDFTYKGMGTPGAQPVFIDTFDGGGNLVSSVAAGLTTPRGVQAVPEPASFSLASMALVLGVAWARRRRSGGLADAVRASVIGFRHR